MDLDIDPSSISVGVERTQLRLKQSCEQKKLSVPIFRQVGH
jgi:hypothetical protein